MIAFYKFRSRFPLQFLISALASLAPHSGIFTPIGATSSGSFFNQSFSEKIQYFPLQIILILYFRNMIDFFIAFLTTINICSFIYFGLDKRKAKKNQQRIPEKSLLIMTLFGGTFGSILGMIFFNHKTAKRNFILKILVILLLQILILYLIYNYYQ